VKANPLNAQETKENSLRLSVWYWLNSAPRTEWAEDFRALSQGGFTHLILCWGLDTAAFEARQADSRYALELCEKNQLKAYLCIWAPGQYSLMRKTQQSHLQVDNRGQVRYAQNLFNREWRQTQWKQYLQSICRSYREMKGLGGYLLDDTFGIGVPSDSSPVADPGREEVAGTFVSYSPADFDRFRTWLRKRYVTLGRLNQAWQGMRSDGSLKPYEDWEEVEPPRKILSELVWADWGEARTEWLVEWARETMQFIRQVDPNVEHEVYTEDHWEFALGRRTWKTPDASRPVTLRDRVGLDFGRVVQPFDAVGAYTAFNWDKTNALQEALTSTQEVLSEMRRIVGGDKKIVYTFWVASWDMSPRELTHPTGEEIARIAQEAVDLGIRHVDYYGYRIGDWRVTSEEWRRLLPGVGKSYPVTKQLPGKFLRDRQEVFLDLAEFNRKLRMH
jgi:hypothetical protein